MRNDPVIEAVREVRHRISASVGHDPQRLVAYYRQRQEGLEPLGSAAVPYRPSSMVLFLTNCSLTKAAGGSAEYDESQAITSALPETLGDRLLKRRAGVFQLVKNAPDFHWQGTPVSELEFNRQLSSGRDIGGRHSAAYLPALDRYEGRFFQALGMAGKRRIVESEHHTLFLSGLYGLLRPTEPIQLYSCPLAPQIAEHWRKSNLLTEVLCEYIQRFQIARIIDLTAIDAYRQLIDWEKIADTKTDVLHCFDVMAAGDSALTSFGKCFADELLGLTEDEIAGLPFEHRLGTVILRSLGYPVAGLPSEDIEGEVPDQSLDIGPKDVTSTPRLPWPFAYTSRFQKDVHDHMDKFTRIGRAMLDICRDPMNPIRSTKQLQGDKKGRRIYRLGDYRIIYRPDKREERVYLERFVPRGDGYKGE